MLNESEWNAQHDQEALENLQRREELLETLLAEHLKSIGYGPAGQGSGWRGLEDPPLSSFLRLGLVMTPQQKHSLHSPDS